MKYIVLFLLITSTPLVSFGKNYDVTMKICDIGTKCDKCYETVKVSYLVSSKNKEVTVYGKDVNGKDVKEVLNNCQISNEDNWECVSSSLVVQVKNGNFLLTNKPESSLVRGKKEVCIVR